MEEPKEYYEAHERVKQAILQYEMENIDVEILGSKEYELEQGKVLVKYLRDRYNLVVIRCYDWIHDYDDQIEVCKFGISDFITFRELFENNKIIL